MTTRLATAADADFILARAERDGQPWSEAKAVEVLTDPRFVTVIDDEGMFYMYSEDGVTVYAGPHIGFESGDEVRYKRLWAFCYDLLLKKWPKAKTFKAYLWPQFCYAPNVYAVATTRTGLTEKTTDARGLKEFEVLIPELGRMLGVRAVRR